MLHKNLKYLVDLKSDWTGKNLLIFTLFSSKEPLEGSTFLEINAGNQQVVFLGDVKKIDF